ncbi:MAG: P-loop NTPase [Lentisphaerae bacterium]|nr:P-loop NTPase [Lentisphaerota bacterium]
MIITVASGKGGTGKTTFAVNLAHVLAGQGAAVRLLDCDVEEPNAHLFVHPTFTEQESVTALKPVLDATKCDGCGICARACHYNAIACVKGQALIFNELCHACGVCAYLCPQKALREEPVLIGRVKVAPHHQPFFFAHGILSVGETLAPNVVEAVKGHLQPEAINILDAAPGTACPVVKALEGADVAVLLTEPTPFGLHDLKLAAAMTLKMGLPTGIVINRSGAHDTLIDTYAASSGIPILGRIPFQRAYAETYSSGALLIEKHPELIPVLLEIYGAIQKLPGSPPPPAPPLPELTVTPGKFKPFPSGTSNAYREVTVISGKGGTGKTTLVAALATLAQKSVLADNDVDAADLHLLLKPQVREAHPFMGGHKATIITNQCVGCGQCAAVCRFAAVQREEPTSGQAIYRINPLACEGCGFCFHVCPAQAVCIAPTLTGEWFVSATAQGPMVHARLGIAEENSGRLVTQVRNRAAELAQALQYAQIISDGPPGVGCPVIASVSGTDLILIVTEPTVSGVHDMQRVLDLAQHFQVPALVVINKADLNAEQAQRITQLAAQYHARVVGQIPFDETINDALIAGQTVIEYAGASRAAAIIAGIWQEVRQALDGPRPVGPPHHS